MMQNIDIIVFLIVLAVLTFAVIYVYRQKKKGCKCIGCPNAGKCKISQGCSSNVNN